MHCERFPIRRLRIIVSEVIDHLFDSHRILWRERPFIYESSNVGIRRRVYIDRERRERIRFRLEEWILENVIVRGGVEIAPRCADVAVTIAAIKFLSRRERRGPGETLKACAEARGRYNFCRSASFGEDRRRCSRWLGGSIVSAIRIDRSATG